MDIDHADVAVAALEALGELHEPGTPCPAELVEMVNQLLHLWDTWEQDLWDTKIAPSFGSRDLSTSPVRLWRALHLLHSCIQANYHASCAR